MNESDIRNLLTQVANGNQDVAQALKYLQHFAFQDLEFAKVDHHRALRLGIPETIYCPGKTPEQIVKIAAALIAKNKLVVATRAEPDAADKVAAILPGTNYEPSARMLYWGDMPPEDKDYSSVAVISAGTADLPIAEEAVLFLKLNAVPVVAIYDIGIAGIHRLTANLDKLLECSIIIVVAGMDGVLPGVVAGLLHIPVIAVPTSVGYGASFGGIAPLLTMLNSCASGLTVVNIDNGFGAAVAALRVLGVQRHSSLESPSGGGKSSLPGAGMFPLSGIDK